MSRCQVIEDFEAAQLKKDLPKFNVGDTVRVHMRIIEGDKERVQVYQGTVIAKKGSGLSETFTVYRNAYGSSMERIFVLHSPRIQKIEVVRAGKVRRAKLYYLRGLSGKKAKVQEMLGIKATVSAQDKQPKPEPKEPVEAKEEKKESTEDSSES